jgi:hypothetical protein
VRSSPRDRPEHRRRRVRVGRRGGGGVGRRVPATRRRGGGRGRGFPGRGGIPCPGGRRDREPGPGQAGRADPPRDPTTEPAYPTRSRKRAVRSASVTSPFRL